MRPLLLAATLALSPLGTPVRAQTPPAASAPAAADWRKASVPDGMQDALRGLGYRFEADGRVLDPDTRAPLTADQLDAALAKLNLSTQRLALERLRLLLDKDAPSAADKAELQALKGNLPADVAAALGRNAGAAELRALADGDLTRIAAVFDGARTLDERLAAAEPVRAGAPGPRVPLPYFTPAEKSVGDALRAATAARLGRDPVGRELLVSLRGPGGTPDLPPVVVEDLSGGAVAAYEYRRGAIALDREAVLDSVTGSVPPKDRPALRAKLSARDVLLAYLGARPDAVAAFAAQNDVVLYHELFHARQDRRDPVLRQMARGNAPEVLVLEYEEEAWTAKNRYLRSKLARDPGAVADDAELADLAAMTRDRATWRRDLLAGYRQYDPTGAMTLAQTREVMALRRKAAAARAVATSDEQRDKSLDLLALGRASADVDATLAAEAARLRAGRRDADASAAETARLLGEHYLKKSLDAKSTVDSSVALAKAEDFAKRSGNADLLARVRRLERANP